MLRFDETDRTTPEAAASTTGQESTTDHAPAPRAFDMSAAMPDPSDPNPPAPPRIRPAQNSDAGFGSFS